MRLPLRKRAPQRQYRLPVPSAKPQLPDGRIAAVYQAARMGGDYYEFLDVGHSRLLFALLDIAGKRETALEVAADVQDTLRSAGPELFREEDVNEAEAIVALTLEMNRTVLKAAEVCCAPAFVGCYNETLGTVCFSNGGHTPGLLKDGQVITELGATGLPLGLFSHLTQDAQIYALPPGACLVLVSRGVIESKSRKSEFGLEGVKKVVQEAGSGKPEELCSDILQAVCKFMGKPPLHNDVTAIALMHQEAAKAAGASC